MTSVRFLRLLPLLVFPGAALAACFDAVNDCERNPNLPCFGGGDGGGGGTTGSMTSGSGGQGGSPSTTTGLDPQCDPLLLMGGATLGANCGVFVDPLTGPGGDGSQSTPFNSVGVALQAQTGQPIYVCATNGSLNESVTLTTNERIVGGLDCEDWSKHEDKTGWTAPQGEIPLRLSGTTAAHVQEFAITARDAMGFDPGTLQGNSSIGVFAEGAIGTLLLVDVFAGTGADGGPGADNPGQAPGRQSMASAFNGNPGGDGIPDSDCAEPAGGAKSFVCPDGLQTIGGAGGPGGLNSGFNGLAGETDPGQGEPNGTAGMGEDTAGWTCANNFGNGEGGHDGPPTGAVGGGTAAGSLSPGGYAGSAGANGTNGWHGQGGGGGGGRRGNSQNGCLSMEIGPGGGSGGAGGCGGLGGGGGGAGGASIGLIAIGSTLLLTQVTLTASTGGAGGEGGDAQTGGLGGLGALGGGNACLGGPGGSGADGATGGGGSGGPSLGIAWRTTMPILADMAISVAASAAPPGLGGNMNADSNAGTPGLTATKQEYP